MGYFSTSLLFRFWNGFSNLIDVTSFTERKQEVKSEATQGVRTSLLETVMALVWKQIITKELEFY